MFSSNVFDYINVLGSTADAAATRHDIISNNIANVKEKTSVSKLN